MSRVTGLFALPLVLLAVLLLGSAAGHAGDPRPLSGVEITKRLTGNTVIGEWNGRAYAQFFNKSGTTLYQQKGAPESRGRWRVSDGKYCSRWGRGSWSCYGVLEGDDGGITWVEPSSGKTHPARVVSGYQVGG
jgi:hypothetical protein